MIEIRYLKNNKWVVLNKVSVAYCTCDISTGTLFKIGDENSIKKDFETRVKKLIDLDKDFLRNTLKDLSLDALDPNDIISDIGIIELPVDQDIIDKIFNNSGFLKKYIDQNKNNLKIKTGKEFLEVLKDSVILN